MVSGSMYLRMASGFIVQNLQFMIHAHEDSRATDRIQYVLLALVSRNFTTASLRAAKDYAGGDWKGGVVPDRGAKGNLDILIQNAITIRLQLGWPRIC